MKKIFPLLFWVGFCEIVGLAATPFTISAISGWYETLAKPSFSPPNWIFGPVWTVLYFLMGVAAFLIWKKGIKKKLIRTSLTYFCVQLGLNFLWSVLFFGWHSPFLGLIDLVALWILIVLTLINFRKISRPAAYILVPYLLWVSFAGALNLAIVMLNP